MASNRRPSGSDKRGGQQGRPAQSKKPKGQSRNQRADSAPIPRHPPLDTRTGPIYPSVIITGRLLVESPLHVGDGGAGLRWTERLADLPADREPPALDHCQPRDVAPADDCLYQGVCHGYHQSDPGTRHDPATTTDAATDAQHPAPQLLPYLPGSTLRGLLRGLLSRTADTHTVATLLGRMARGPADALGGRLRIHDAPLLPGTVSSQEAPPFWSAQRQTAARHGIALDPRTGSVAEGLLFSHEIIPPGARFALTFAASDLAEDHLRSLLAALHDWDGDLDTALGTRTGKGWGRVRWQPDAVRVLSEAALGQWLRGDDPHAALPWQARADLLDSARPRAQPTQRPIGVRHGRLYLDLCIRPEGPILVHEPGRRPRETADQPHPPHLYYSRAADGTPLLPGSSLVGLLRARARRILTTIAAGLLPQPASAPPGDAPTDPADPAERIADALLARLFGGPTRRGALWLGDARADGSLADPDIDAEPETRADEGKQVRLHEQTFIAIDRFTGGGKSTRGEGALYQVQATVGGSFRAPLLLELARLTRQEQDERHPHWWRGLLLLVARDACEGDLALGWGKGRGLGAIRVMLHPSAALPHPSWAGRLAQPIHALANGHGEAWPRLLAWLAEAADPGPSAWLTDLHARLAQEAARLQQPLR